MDYVARTPQQLGNLLKASRKRLNLSQADFGAKTGFDQSRISRIESLTATTSIENLYRAISALGLELVLRDPPTEKSREW